MVIAKHLTIALINIEGHRGLILFLIIAIIINNRLQIMQTFSFDYAAFAGSVIQNTQYGTTPSLIVSNRIC
jgi:hypothetical protein